MNPEQIELPPKSTNCNFKDPERRCLRRLYVAGYLVKRYSIASTYWLLHGNCGNFGRASTQQLTGG